MAEHPIQIAAPRSLKGNATGLVIEWPDGVTHRLSWQLLRDRCPCATCRHLREQPPAPATLLPVLSPQEAQPLRVTAMRPVGNYAYSIEFSDRHNTGIYSLEFLRRLGEEGAAEH